MATDRPKVLPLTEWNVELGYYGCRQSSNWDGIGFLSPEAGSLDLSVRPPNLTVKPHIDILFDMAPKIYRTNF
jgi:hypothetical protein